MSDGWKAGGTRYRDVWCPLPLSVRPKGRSRSVVCVCVNRKSMDHCDVISKLDSWDWFLSLRTVRIPSSLSVFDSQRISRSSAFSAPCITNHPAPSTSNVTRVLISHLHRISSPRCRGGSVVLVLLFTLCHAQTLNRSQVFAIISQLSRDELERLAGGSAARALFSSRWR